MAGLFGFVGRPRGTDARALGEKLRSILHQSPYEKIDLWTGDEACLGVVHLGLLHPAAQPAHDPGTGTRLVLDGEISEPERLAARLQAAGVAVRESASEPELLLALYQSLGPGAFADLDGNWAVAIVDGSGLTLITDRLGSRPIMTAKTPWGTAFFPELKGVLALEDHGMRIDRNAVVEFFLLHFVMGTKTFIEGVTLVPPATVMRVEGDEISARRYWTVQAPRVYETRTDAEWIEGYATRLQRAVRKRVSKPPTAGLTLSGGFDTRLILAATDRSRPPLHTFTFGEPRSWDRRFARRAARARGTVHHETGPCYEEMVARLDRYVWFTDGMIPCHHGQIAALFPLLRENVDVVLEGISAATGPLVLYARGRLHAMAKTPEDDFIRRMHAYRTAARPALFRTLLADSYGALVDEYPTQEFVDNLGDPDDFPWIRAVRFAWTQHLRRFSGTGGRYLRTATEVRQPLCDYDLLDYTLQLPLGVLIDPNFVHNVASRLAPELDRVPFARDGLPGIPTLAEQFWQWRVNQVKNWLGRVTGGGIPRRDSRVLIDHAVPLAGRFGERVATVLTDSRLAGRGILNGARVREIVREHEEGRTDHTKLLWTLFGFELWCRQFFDGEHLE